MKAMPSANRGRSSTMAKAGRHPAPSSVHPDAFKSKKSDSTVTQTASNGMTESATPGLTIGQLEAKYPMYCKAMRLLLREGCTLKQIQRTVCWDRLEILHNSLPKSYKSPEYLFLLFRREWEQHKAALA